MTDRYSSLTVVLAHDTRDDDAEPLINAIRHLRGVLSVTGNVVDPLTHVAEIRVRNELEDKLWRVLYPEKANG